MLARPRPDSSGHQQSVFPGRNRGHQVRRPAPWLISLNHRRIAFCRPVPEEEVHPREAAFLEAMARAGLPDGAASIIPFQAINDKNGPAKLKELFDRAEAPSAIFVGNDRVGMMVLKHLAALNIRAPEDCVCNRVRHLRFTEHLQPKQEMGRRAVELLLEAVEYPSARMPRRGKLACHLASKTVESRTQALLGVDASAGATNIKVRSVNVSLWAIGWPLAPWVRPAPE